MNLFRISYFFTLFFHQSAFKRIKTARQNVYMMKKQRIYSIEMLVFK